MQKSKLQNIEFWSNGGHLRDDKIILTFFKNSISTLVEKFECSMGPIFILAVNEVVEKFQHVK